MVSFWFLLVHIENPRESMKQLLHLSVCIKVTRYKVNRQNHVFLYVIGRQFKYKIKIVSVYTNI